MFAVVSVATVLAAAPSVPTLHQGSGPGCAVYAAVAVAQAWGHPVEPREVLRAVPVSRDGIAYADVASALRQRGVVAEWRTLTALDLERLLARGEPVVLGQATAQGGHAIVVVSRGEGDTFTIMDPANPGRRVRSRLEVVRAWQATGHSAIVIAPPRVQTER